MTRPEHWWLTSARFNIRLQISFAAEFENSKCYPGAGICRLDLRAADGKSRSSITRPRDSILRMLSVGLAASLFVLQKKQAHTGLVI